MIANIVFRQNSLRSADEASSSFGRYIFAERASFDKLVNRRTITRVEQRCNHPTGDKAEERIH